MNDLFKNFDKFFVGFPDFSALNAEFNKNLSNYPFYNIKKLKEDHYVIEMAVAGFSKSEIEVILDDNKLIVKGFTSDEEDTTDASVKNTYLYKAITNKPFERMFALSDRIEVQSSELVNGMLRIYLEKITPETKKPKKIEVKSKDE